MKAHGQTFEVIDNDHGREVKVDVTLHMHLFSGDTPRRCDACNHEYGSCFKCPKCDHHKDAVTLDDHRSSVARCIKETRDLSAKSTLDGHKLQGKGIKEKGSPFVHNEAIDSIHARTVSDPLHVITLGPGGKYPIIKLRNILKDRFTLGGRVVPVELQRLYAAVSSTERPQSDKRHLVHLTTFSGGQFRSLRFVSEVFLAAASASEHAAANELVPLLESAFKLLRIVGHRGTTASQREAISSDEVMEPIAKHFGSTPKGHLLIRHLREELEVSPPFYSDQERHESSNAFSRLCFNKSNGRHRSRDIVEKALELSLTQHLLQRGEFLDESDQLVTAGATFLQHADEYLADAFGVANEAARPTLHNPKLRKPVRTRGSRHARLSEEDVTLLLGGHFAANSMPSEHVHVFQTVSIGKYTLRANSQFVLEYKEDGTRRFGVFVGALDPDDDAPNPRPYYVLKALQSIGGLTDDCTAAIHLRVTQTSLVKPASAFTKLHWMQHNCRKSQCFERWKDNPNGEFHQETPWYIIHDTLVSLN
eukprot:m.67072 g.67072  ORF g.67072 m.67072 type:complete len:534 (+) comp14075_c0_seq5:1130-2731(+)